MAKKRMSKKGKTGRNASTGNSRSMGRRSAMETTRETRRGAASRRRRSS